MDAPSDSTLERGRHSQSFRRLLAYAVSADGTRQRLDCDVIEVELDSERGLRISLAERMPGEGIAIRSLPQAQSPSAPSLSGDGEPAAKDPARVSTLVMRSGGANLLCLSSELQPRMAAENV